MNYLALHDTAPPCPRCGMGLSLLVTPWPAGGYLLRWHCLGGPTPQDPVGCAERPDPEGLPPTPNLAAGPEQPAPTLAFSVGLVRALRTATGGLTEKSKRARARLARETEPYLVDAERVLEHFGTSSSIVIETGPVEPEPDRAELAQTVPSSPDSSAWQALVDLASRCHEYDGGIEQPTWEPGDRGGRLRVRVRKQGIPETPTTAQNRRVSAVLGVNRVRLRKLCLDHGCGSPVVRHLGAGWLELEVFVYDDPAVLTPGAVLALPDDVWLERVCPEHGPMGAIPRSSVVTKGKVGRVLCTAANCGRVADLREKLP